MSECSVHLWNETATNDSVSAHHQTSNYKIEMIIQKKINNFLFTNNKPASVFSINDHTSLCGIKLWVVFK